MSNDIYVLYNWFLWVLAFLVAYGKVISYKKVGIDGFNANVHDKSRYRFLFLIFIFYSLFTFFGGDRSGYEEMVVDSARYGDRVFISMESIYRMIAVAVNGNFILWKLLVYGCALLMISLSMKRLKVDNIITLIVFTGMCLFSYGAARGVLAYAIYLFGLSFIKEKKIILVLFGWAIIVCSYFFHNSMISIIAITPLVYLKLTRKRVLLLLLLFPVVQLAFNMAIGNIYDYVDFYSEEYEQELLQNKYRSYSNDNNIEKNALPLHQIVQNILDYSIYIPLIWFSFKLYFKNKLDRKLTSYISIVFFVLYLTFLFRFSPIHNNELMYRRFLGMVPFYLFILAVPVFNLKEIKLSWLQLYLWVVFIKCNYTFLLITYHSIIR